MTIILELNGWRRVEEVDKATFAKIMNNRPYRVLITPPLSISVKNNGSQIPPVTDVVVDFYMVGTENHALLLRS